MLNNGELPACSRLYSAYSEENAKTIEHQPFDVESTLKKLTY